MKESGVMQVDESVYSSRYDCYTDSAAHTIQAKFHYTGRPDPTGPDRTRTDFVGDLHGPTEFLGDPGRSGPCRSGRVRAGPFGSGRVWSGPCSGI